MSQTGAFRSALPTRRAGSAGVLCCLLVLHAAPGRAQTAEALGPAAPASAATGAQDSSEQPSSAADPAQAPALRFLEGLARDRFNQAVIGADPELLERALDALRLGMALSPAPGFAFNAALVEQRLGHCGAAQELFRRFLALPTSAKSRARAEQALAELESCEEPAPDRLSLVAPDVEIGLRQPSRAALASHTLVAWADLPDSAAEPGLALAPIAFWTLSAAAALSLTYAGVSLGRAWSAEDDLEWSPSDPRSAEQLARVQREGRSAQTQARWFGGLGVGLGLAAGGVYWLTHSPAPAVGAGPSRVQPLAAPSALGAAWAGSF